MITEDLLKNWNMNGNTRQIYNTAWEVEDNYVIKVYEDLGGLERNIVISKILRENGIPAANIIPTAEGENYVLLENRYFILMEKLKGSHIKDIYQNINYAYKTGEIIAGLHIALKECGEKMQFWDNSLLEEMKGWIYESLEKKGFPEIAKEEVESIITELETHYEELPKQPIHRDVHMGNFLFEDGKVSGYIDFDLSQRNIRVFDLCYFLLGVLTEHIGNKTDENTWFWIAKEFIRGYESINCLLDIEKKSFACIMKAIEILFVAYFTNNKNEDLAKNAAELFYFVQENAGSILEAVK